MLIQIIGNMKNRLIKALLIIVLGIPSIVIADTETSTGCSQCKVSDANGKVVFSCKTTANESCSYNFPGKTLNCYSAKKC
jgi:hypothetical protein